MKKYLPLALQGVALAVAIGWALDVHVPGLDEPLVPVLKPAETRVQVQVLPAQPPTNAAQVHENKVEIRSFKGQVAAARAQQWKQAGQSVSDAISSLTSQLPMPNLEILPNLNELPDVFTLADLPPIPDMPSPIEWPKPTNLSNIDDKRQDLPPLGKDLPPSDLPDTQQTFAQAAESTQQALVQAAETTQQALVQAVETAQQAFVQAVETTQNALAEVTESATSALNATAQAAEASVTHVANAVAAEVTPQEVTPLDNTPQELAVSPMAEDPAPAVNLPLLGDNQVFQAEETAAASMAIEPKTEVVAIAPESVPAAIEASTAPATATSTASTAAPSPVATAPVASTAEAPLYPKVGNPNAKAKVEAQAEEPASVVLKEIRFKGAKYFSHESLQAMVAKFIGIPLQYNDLLDIGFAVENFYKKNNHLARVMLTQQDVTEGVLTLDVIESRLSKISVDQQVSALPNTQAHVLALIEQQHPKDSTFNAAQVDRALALANEVPGISVSGALHEGDELGETELILKLYQNQSRQAELVMDNVGSRATGAERVMGNATFINPTDHADTFSLSSILTRGSEYFRAAYSLPIGRDGWRLGLNASAMDYKLVVGDIGVVGGFGKAFTEGFELIYPLDRSPDTSSTFTLTGEAKQFKNVMYTGIVMTDYDAEVLVAQFSGVDRAFTKTSGVFNYNLQLSHGLIDLHDNGMTNAATDQNHINGAFNKLRTNLTFIEPWTPNTDLYISFNGQLADKNLDSSEKFQLGGANGIRAYPTGEGSGSDGKMLNFELRHRFENGVTLTGFYDWGHVDDLHTPGPAKNGPNSYDLKGFGLSASYNFRNGVVGKATWATRDGDNPNPKIPSGSDQDGSRDRNRFWLQVTVPF